MLKNVVSLMRRVWAAIRADETLRDTPLLMLSARAGEEARLEGLHAGARAPRTA